MFNYSTYKNCIIPVLVLNVGEVDCPPQVRRPSASGMLLLNVILMVLVHSASQVIVSALIALTVTSQTGAASEQLQQHNVYLLLGNRNSTYLSTQKHCQYGYSANSYKYIISGE